MRAQRILAVAVLAVLVPEGRVDARTASCPSECRRTIEEVMCRQEIIETSDRVTTINYYWSSGV